jgi:protein-L-isoaspartate(D-aspartate) O-methyltransferase
MTKLRIKAFRDAKRKLVEELKEKGIKSEKVLNAFLDVPRHMFVPYILRFDSYKDVALPIGKNQTISRPYTVALMTEALNIEKEDIILEIGTGSGFQTAILAYLAKFVFTIEVFGELSQNAEKIHKLLGLKNIRYKIGDGIKGWKDFAPFNKILVTAALNKEPDILFSQLKEGGSIIYPLIDSENQILVKSTINNKKNSHIILDNCNFVISN